MPAGWTAGAALGALGLALWCWRSPAWRAAGGWLALGLLGFAASLSLIEAGPVVRYQHYLPPSGWPSAAPWAVAVLGGQVLLVVWGWWARRRSFVLGASLPRRFGLAVTILAFVLTSATLSAEPARYLTELLVASLLQGLHLATVLLAAVSIPTAEADAFGRRVTELLGPSTGTRSDSGPRLDRVAVAMAMFATILSAFLAWSSYQWHPHVPDEVAYLIHGRYFADGLLWLPKPEPYGGFDIDLMFADGARWYSPVPPGWPAVLAVGVRLGLPWLVNPVLTGINVLLFHRLLWEIFDRRTARVGAVLFAISPWNLFLGMSLLTHASSLAAALIAAVAVASWRRRPRPWLLIAGGVGIGAVSLIRPLEGLIVAMLLGPLALFTRPWRRGVIGASVLAATTALTASIVGPYNAALSGSARVFPIMRYTDTLYGPGTNALGFGPNRGLGWSGLDPFPGHGLIDVLVNANLNLFTLNVELLGWATGSILLVLFGMIGRRWSRGDWWMAAVLVAVIGTHTFYWFSGGPDFGPRYWYLIVVPCLGFAARGLLKLLDDGNPRSSGQAAAALTGLAFSGLLVFVPWRAVDKYHGYRGMTPEIFRIADSAGFGRDLVLISGHRHPDFASAAVGNRLALDGDAPIYAWDRNPAVRDSLLDRFPDRRVWLVDGPTRTGGGYRIRLGPIAPQARGSIPAAPSLPSR